MSQDRIKGEIVFICDDCNDALETEATDFDHANKQRVKAGWQAYFDDGDWYHRCPDCQN